MGTIYANITLKGPKAQDILQELGNQGRSAFVSADEDGMSTIYEMDSDEGDSSTLTDLAEDLSSCFGCPALAVQTLDEEQFCYWLYADGELLDAYRSPSQSLDPEGTNSSSSKGGKPGLLAQLFNTDVSSEEITEILHCPDVDCGFSLAVDRHLSLVELLGLPLCSVGFGFCDLDSGEYPEELEEENLLRIDVD